MDRTFCVYLHRKPNTMEVFYVGYSGGKQRPYKTTGRNTHWTNTYNKYGRTVEIAAEGLSKEEACELEKFIIKTIGKENLTNITDGGEGNNYWEGKKFSKEHRKRMSESFAGKKLSKEHKENISKAFGERRKKGLKYKSPPKGMRRKTDNVVIDTLTGVFYRNINEAADHQVGHSKSHFYRMMIGTRTNKTHYEKC